MSNPKSQIIGLNTLALRGNVPGMGHTDVAIRAHKKRVFTEAEYQSLLKQSVAELRNRIIKGDILIADTVSKIGDKLAAPIVSNLKFQQDEIQKIIDSKLKIQE